MDAGAAPRRIPTGDAGFQELERLSRHPLTPERRRAAIQLLSAIYSVIDRLDSLELDDVPPATAFDARW
jgi:Asp-tRNA(Asn)/Glu-tRNA(Gln) amidotransferase C subunit